MEQDSEVTGPRTPRSGGRPVTCECWLSPGGQGGTSSTTPPPWAGGCILCFPTPSPPSLKPSPQASKHKTIQEGKPALVAGIR